MSTEREALKLALEELAVRFSEGWHEGIKIDASDIVLLSDAAEALAQPEQEPLAWMEGESVYWHTNPSLNDWIRANGTPLYTTPPQPKVRTGDCLLTGVCASEGHKIQKAQPERVASQEPVGRLESDPYEGHVFIPRIDGDWSMLGKDLYTTPPQRKPLTDEQITQVANSVYGETDVHSVELIRIDFARAIEAAHGIKE